MDSQETSTTFKVLMLPWLAHGHISPFLELAKKLSKRKLHIYFCSTPINLNSIQKNSSPPIQFIELNLPSLPNLPPCNHTTNGLPPHLMSTLVSAFEMASPRISAILESLSPDLLIYDIYQSWVPPLALSHHIPAVHFQTSAASTMSFFLRLYKHRAAPFPFPAIYIRESEIRRMRPVAPSSDASSINDKDLIFKGIEQSNDIILIKSCEEIEGKYIDFLSNLSKKKIIPVGPLVQDIVVEDDDQNEIIRWLNEKDPFSSVFVSFGSEYFLSEEEMEEIAYGLELSGVNFVWVIRFSAGERKEIEEVVPKGFLERTKERGMLVKGWAPQAKILGHSSIGGFVSHCGWSSVMESISFGVPIIALPMQLDQPLNARLVVEVGVGAEVMKGENGEFKREELSRVIKEVVVEESGEYVRKKAKELSEKIRMNGEEEIDVLVGELTQLCEKNK